jgi:4-hydroxy-3-methylbut-2-enyl diphosphate reductase
VAVTAEGKNMPASDRATLLLMQPRGFCAGVIRAIEVVELALQKLGRPVYVRKEIVHNRHVVEDLAARGAVFVESLKEVPSGGVVIFSAHGVSPSVRKAANDRGLRVIDATCPLVTKVHLEVIRYAREDYTILLIGHRDHDEVIGTLGEAPDAIRVISSAEDVDSLEVEDPQRVVYLTQTTLGIDDTAEIVTKLKQRFPAIQGPPARDICYATENRQAALKIVARQADAILVVGAKNSSNSNRLVEVARRAGTDAYLITCAADIEPRWIEGRRQLGITAGASTPDFLVVQVVDLLKSWGFTSIREVELTREDVRFALPGELISWESTHWEDVSAS